MRPIMAYVATVLPPNNGRIYYQLISMTHLIKIMYLYRAQNLCLPLRGLLRLPLPCSLLQG